MKKTSLLTLFASMGFLIACNSSSDDPKTDSINIPEGYTMVWNDEFDSESIDVTKWAFQTGDGTDYGLPVGWGNDERQIYTDQSDNVRIVEDNGESVLAITALSDNSGGFTSARVVTSGLSDFRFGRFEIRAKMPQGQGIWPAIWLLGDNIDLIDWPGCGEIDIVEVLGNNPSTMYSTVHYTNAENSKGETQDVYQLASGSFSDNYHTYVLDWTPESITVSIDGIQAFQVPIEDDMKEFQRSMYLIMNVAVGGFWPGYPDATTQFPQTMYVDYVRVFTDDDLQVPEEPTLNIEEETFGQVIEPSVADNAIKDDFDDLGSITVLVWGGGGEPEISTSETAIDGDLSLVMDFPGGAWGGSYIEMASAQDLSGYSNLVFSLNKPADFVDVEVKLESPSTNFTVYLVNYTGVEVANGFYEYTIPLTDFTGVDFTELTIPFALWNPVDADGNFVQATVLVDNLHFSE